jgi:hypothetical protein
VVGDSEAPQPSPAGGDGPIRSESPARADTVDVACWTPVGSTPDTTRPEPRATLIATPATPGAVDAVVHTLVLEVDGPMASVAIDYRPLDAAVVPEDGVRVRTDDDRPIAVDEARVADGGTFAVTFADRPTGGALFLEYSVTKNPDGGRHAVDVVVDGERHTEAGLVVVG